MTPPLSLPSDFAFIIAFTGLHSRQLFGFLDYFIQLDA